ncbi:MAG: FoF1 ATP synthase subunit delta/epsilon [Phycisphaerae bacterium]
MKKDRAFKCELLTPYETVCQEQTVGVTFRAVDGDMGILANRAPLVAKMGAGRVLLERSGGSWPLKFYASGGFAQMHDNTLTILAEDCVPLEKLDPEQAWDELQKVRDWPSETDAQARAKAEAMQTAREKFRLAQEVLRDKRKAMGVEPGRLRPE